MWQRRTIPGRKLPRKAALAAPGPGGKETPLVEPLSLCSSPAIGYFIRKPVAGSGVNAAKRLPLLPLGKVEGSTFGQAAPPNTGEAACRNLIATRITCSEALHKFPSARATRADGKPRAGGEAAKLLPRQFPVHGKGGRFRYRFSEYPFGFHGSDPCVTAKGGSWSLPPFAVVRYGETFCHFRVFRGIPY